MTYWKKWPAAKTLGCELIRFQSVRGSQDQYTSDRPAWEMIQI